MARLEQLTPGATVCGILQGESVTIIEAKWYGASALELLYRDQAGNVHNELVFRDKEPMLEVVIPGIDWSLGVDGNLIRLVSEAMRIRLAHLFDPLLAVHTSIIEPLPHQITAVYGEMLTRQPLRFLLADDPGSGKTIMAGLLIKELIIRGDVKRCLVVCPGSLATQWQRELYQRFHVPFQIASNELLQGVVPGDFLHEAPLVIARLDKLARNEDLQARLANTDWDLVICDEAHKMSASFFGGEVKETKRYRLGRLLSSITRHFLLMTATPHNGKEEDFQLFMGLLDGDRFDGRFRDGVHSVDVSDLMRSSTYSHVKPRATSYISRGLPDGLYRHQLLALQSVLKGQHTCLATGTASGKSAVFYGAALELLFRNPEVYDCSARRYLG